MYAALGGLESSSAVPSCFDMLSFVFVDRSSILSSGTVGAAIEASLMGVRGIALSFPFTKGFNNWTDSEVVSLGLAGIARPILI